MYYNYFWLFSYPIIITVFYLIDADIYLNPKVLSLGKGFLLESDVDAVTVFRLMVLAIFYILQHKSIFNQTSGSNITMPNSQP